MWHFQVEIGSLWDHEYKAWTNLRTFLLRVAESCQVLLSQSERNIPKCNTYQKLLVIYMKHSFSIIIKQSADHINMK